MSAVTKYWIDMLFSKRALWMHDDDPDTPHIKIGIDKCAPYSFDLEPLFSDTQLLSRAVADLVDRIQLHKRRKEFIDEPIILLAYDEQVVPLAYVLASRMPYNMHGIEVRVAPKRKEKCTLPRDKRIILVSGFINQPMLKELLTVVSENCEDGVLIDHDIFSILCGVGEGEEHFTHSAHSLIDVPGRIEKHDDCPLCKEGSQVFPDMIWNPYRGMIGDEAEV